MPIRLGLSLSQNQGVDLSRDISAVAKAAEEIGYDSIWVFERFLFTEPHTHGLFGMPGVPWPDYYRSVADPVVTLSMAAAVTERVKLGTSVLAAPLHQPFRLARTLATLDNASGGRVIAGFGTGWSPDEVAAAGLMPFERRGAALDELLDVCAAVWGPNPVSYQGELTTIAPSLVDPKPAGPIPVLLSGTNARTFRRIVDRADGWMPVAMMDASELAAQWKHLQALAVERGRTRPVGLTLRTGSYVTADPLGEDRQPFNGTLRQLAEDAVRFAEAVPLDELVLDLTLGLPTGRQLIDWAGELFTAIRAAGV